MRPADVIMNDVGILTDALGKAELEAAAALVVRYHIAHGLEDWTPLTRRQIGEWLTTDDVVRKWAENPFWRPDPDALVEKGFVDGWTTVDEPGMFTPLALARIEHRGKWGKS